MPVIDDDVANEADEQFSMVITEVTPAGNITDGESCVTIIDDDSKHFYVLFFLGLIYHTMRWLTRAWDSRANGVNKVLEKKSPIFDQVRLEPAISGLGAQASTSRPPVPPPSITVCSGISTRSLYA